MIDGSMHVCAQLNTRYVCTRMSVQLSLFCVLCTCRYRGQAVISRGCFAGCLARNSFLCQSGIAVKVYPSAFTCPPAHEFSKPSFHPFTHLCTHPPTKHFSIHLLSTTHPTHILMVFCAPFNRALSTTHPSSTCLPTHLPTHPSIHPSTIYPPIHPTSTHHTLTHSFIYATTHWPPPIHSSTQLIFSWFFMHPSTMFHPPSTHLPIHSLTHLSIHPSTIDTPTHSTSTHPLVHPPTIH